MSLFDVFVGSEIGYLKGISLSKKVFQNLNKIENVAKTNEILSMCWANKEQNKIYCALKNRHVNLFDSTSHSFTQTLEITEGEGHIRGLASHEELLFTAVESGLVQIWKNKKCRARFETGSNLCCLKHSLNDVNIFASGGKENELKIWDIENNKLSFVAKNVKKDFLRIRVPVWVTNIEFIPNSSKVITTTGHHQIRVYDPSCSQRRPVLDMEFDEHPITAMSLTNKEHHVVVGNSCGKMALLDLRQKGLMIHCYKGFAGSIRSIQCHETNPFVASCGLDRFLRVHNSDNHKLVFKVYMKSRLNCLLFSKFFEMSEECSSGVNLNLKRKNVSSGEAPASQDEEDQIWNSMVYVTDNRGKKKQYSNLVKFPKKRLKATIDKSL